MFVSGMDRISECEEGGREELVEVALLDPVFGDERAVVRVPRADVTDLPNLTDPGSGHWAQRQTDKGRACTEGLRAVRARPKRVREARAEEARLARARGGGVTMRRSEVSGAAP